MYPLLILLLLGQPMAQGQLIVEPGFNSANIMLTGMIDMSAYEFRVLFDETVEATAVLRGNDWQEQAYLWHAGEIAPGSVGYTSGTAYTDSNGYPVGISGDLHLATIKFSRVGVGSTLISLVDVLITDSSGNEIEPEIINARLRVLSYPKPVPK